MSLVPARRPLRRDPPVGDPGLVWYAAYGSNMLASRLEVYLRGGQPPGGGRAYPGARDPAPPRAAVPVLLPGRMYFALESAAWGGGLALYDPLDDGEIPAHAYLLTLSQFSDVAAQEMYGPPDADLRLGEALAHGRATHGPGRYETLVCPGWLDGHPVLTFTAPWRSGDVTANAPAPAYLRLVADGLARAHGWPADRVGTYLAACPGARGTWSPEAVAALVTTPPPPAAELP